MGLTDRQALELYVACFTPDTTDFARLGESLVDGGTLRSFVDSEFRSSAVSYQVTASNRAMHPEWCFGHFANGFLEVACERGWEGIGASAEEIEAYLADRWNAAIDECPYYGMDRARA